MTTLLSLTFYDVSLKYMIHSKIQLLYIKDTNTPSEAILLYDHNQSTMVKYFNTWSLWQAYKHEDWGLKIPQRNSNLSIF